MATDLGVPPGLTPKELTYWDRELPITDNLKSCMKCWKQGDLKAAIQSVRQVLELARAHNHFLSESVVCVCLADLYREVGQLGPALKYHEQASEAFGMQPKYEHREHAEAVIHYLEGLLFHVLGAHTKAQVIYKESIDFFEEAAEHWRSNAVKMPEMAERCENAVQWIEVLCKYLRDNLSSSTCKELGMQIPAVTKEEYKLACVELEVVYRLSPEVLIDDERYRMHDLQSGQLLNEPLIVTWDAHYLTIQIPENGWTGPEGDYLLVEWKRKADKPAGYGVLRDNERTDWEYGVFINTERLWFYPIRLIGARSAGEKVEDQDIAIAKALLKSV